jgi:hypothetical protein
MNPSCSNCHFWFRRPAPASSVMGICHRFPPTPIVNLGIEMGMGVFPMTGQDIWCGEHLEREPLADAPSPEAEPRE